MKSTLFLLAALGLLTGCHKNTAETSAGPVESPTVHDAGAPAIVDSGTRVQGGLPAAREACVDHWLQEKKLDRYGNAEGTMYAGGSPLFNEATGETTDRLQYIFSRQPDAQKACPGTSAQ